MAIAGAIVLALIYFFGRPRRPGQGRRMPFLGAADARDAHQRDGERVEPTLGDVPEQGELEVDQDAAESGAGPVFDATDAARPQRPPAGSQRPAQGARPEQAIDRIVTLFVAGAFRARPSAAPTSSWRPRRRGSRSATWEFSIV